MKPLVAYGFLDIQLQDNLANICEAIPRAREIARLGPEQPINTETWRFLSRSLEKDDQYIGWHIGTLYREGTYGKIFRAHRMVVKRRPDGLFDVVEAPHDVIVKSAIPSSGAILPPDEVSAHTSEALLHVLAWRTIQQTAVPWAIPRPYEVFGDYSQESPGWKSMSLGMSYVNGRTLHSYMQKYWSVSTLESNTRSFLEIIAQAAYILDTLQSRMRLNHRDVKVNNVLIRKHPKPTILEIDGVMIATDYELTLIDFGFACVGCPPPREPTTVFQAGVWFPMGEICCKAGRDLAQLIFCIHCYFPVEEYLLPTVAEAVRSWMQISWSGGVADALHGFTKEGRPRRAAVKGRPEYNTGIYEFLRRPDVDPTTCAPRKVFKACRDLAGCTL